MKTWRRLIAAAAAAATGSVVALLVAAWMLPAAAPPAFDDVRGSWCPSDVRVLDRHGVALQEIRVDPSGRRLAWTPLVEVSPALVDAVLWSEDRRFASHHGVDWRAVAAALWQEAGAGPLRGASTLTMQVAALVDPALRRAAGGRSIVQKWMQMRAALRLEESWSKDRILEAYLNLVTFRGEVRGVRAAADALFGKQPHGLDAAESAVLAASLRAPNADEETLRRRAEALARGLASSRHDTVAAPADIDDAVARAGRMPDARGPKAASAPHAARILAASAPRCRDIPSPLDATLQAVAEESLHRHLAELLDRSARDGAVLVVDNASGEVLAYVGSSADLSPSPNVDGVRARRQAGSTLKPFLYASAIDRGLVTAATLLEDSPLDVSVEGGAYRPANYDHAFRGLVSVRTALASSLNVPAVRTLLLVGDEAFARTLRELGIDGVDQAGSFYGPSLALGSADVSLWELVGAYRALANGGSWTPLRWSPGGAGDVRQVFGEGAAFVVGHILADREGRAATFGLESALATPYWTAVKTGTSKDMRDNWCIGFSRRFTVGVWVGNFSGEPMHDVSGVTGAAPVWQDVMDALHARAPGEEPPVPDGVVTAWTAFADDAEAARDEVYLRGSEPVAAPRATDGIARIASPEDGSIFAVDPDIAPRLQKVPLVAKGARDGLRWSLDGHDLGSAASPLLWDPVRGRHELALVDREGRRGAVSKFLVKGSTVEARAR